MKAFKKLEKPVAIMVLGRPGSGKNTQADLLAKHYNLFHIETSKLIQEEFINNAEDQEVKRQKKIFDSGQLNTPSWVVLVLKKKVSSLLFNERNGIVFSGSPRTIYEAENILSFLEEKFGRKNLLGIYLDVTEEEGIKRIVKRNERPLDRDINILKVRMKEFDERTAPILSLFKKYNILKDIDGMPVPKIIFENIKKTPFL